MSGEKRSANTPVNNTKQVLKYSRNMKKRSFVNITHFPQRLVNNTEFCPAYSLHGSLRITHILKYVKVLYALPANSQGL